MWASFSFVVGVGDMKADQDGACAWWPYAATLMPSRLVSRTLPSKVAAIDPLLVCGHCDGAQLFFNISALSGGCSPQVNVTRTFRQSQRDITILVHEGVRKR